MTLATCAAILTAAEWALRLFYPWEVHRLGDWVHVIAPMRIVYEQRLPGVKESVVYTTNAFGLRSLSMRTRRKPPGTVRILCLGASTTISPNQETPDIWCSLLEAELRARGFDRVETAAYGMSGWTAFDLADWIKNNALRYEPDVVVTLMGVNDLTWTRTPRPARRSALFRLAQQCKARLQLCRALEVVKMAATRPTRRAGQVDWGGEALERLREELRNLPHSPRPRRSPDPAQDFEAHMRRLAEFLRTSGVDGLMLGQAVSWRVGLDSSEAGRLWFSVKTASGPVRADPGWLASEMRRYNEIQRRIAAQNGLSYFDLDAAVPKDFKHYFDDCHFTDRGHRVAAAALAPAVARLISKRASARVPGAGG